MTEQELRREAYTLVLEANEAYAKGRFDAALDAYARAYQIREDPELLYRIGQTQERMGNYYGARTSLQAYLEQVPTTRYRQNIEAKIEQLAQREKDAQPKIILATEPPGATILLDGAPVSGTTPQTLRVGTGEHTLRVELEGYLPSDENVMLETGQVLRRQIYLAPRTAKKKEEAGELVRDDLTRNDFADPSEITPERGPAPEDEPIVEGAPRREDSDGGEGARVVPVVVDITPSTGANLFGWGSLVVGGVAGVVGYFLRRQNPGVPFQVDPVPVLLMGTGAALIAGGSVVLFWPGGTSAYRNLPKAPKDALVEPGQQRTRALGVGIRRLF